MIEALQRGLLRWLRVPPEPAPPVGAQGSLRVFHAGKNYLRLRYLGWVGKQLAAVFGILVSVMFIRELEWEMAVLDAQEEARISEEPEAAVAPVIREIEPGVYVTDHAESVPLVAVPEPDWGLLNRYRDRFRFVSFEVVPQWSLKLMRMAPGSSMMLMKVVETVGVLVFVLQLPITWWMLRLEYLQRWYMVTDRSLRLRSGIVKIQETTMSFANLQQVSVHQGPVQRLMRLADVKVQSAGGGGKNDEEEKDSMHLSTFQSVDNAPEIRDLILERLKQFRQAGLGDPDDPGHESMDTSGASPPVPNEDGAGTAIDAARAVLAEARALKEALR